MIEQVTKKGWQTSDGNFFEDEAEAEKHEFRVEMTRIVDRFHFYDMSAGDIVDGLVENIERIKDALR